jgi:hypothetical protein
VRGVVEVVLGEHLPKLTRREEGVMQDARFRKPITLEIGMRMSGNGRSCTGCGMAYNDKFIFENVAL